MASRGSPATPSTTHGPWRRLTVASATMSAGACVFFVAGTGAAAAATPHPAVKASPQSTCDLACQLHNIWNKVTGTGHQANPPSNPVSSHPRTGHSGSSHTGSTTHSSSSHSSHSSGSSGSPGSSSATNGATTPMSVPGGTAPVVAAPQATQIPQLPDIPGSQDPVVFPDQSNAPRQVHLVAAAQDQTLTTSPQLVAAASGIIAVVAALNLGVLSRWLRRQPTR